MKTRLFKAAVAIALVASAPAWAADLPVKAAPPAVIAPTWTGLYLGANVGYSAGTSSVGSTTNLVGVFTASLVGASDLSLTGAVGGGQIGYNWQFNPNWLVGVEVDYDWTGQRGGALFNDPLVAVRETVEAKLNWLATIRARFGYITGNSLWYVTGGWADGRRELNTTFTFLVPPTVAGALNVRSAASGWTVGGGVETKLWNSNWSAKLEYLHVDLGSLSTVTPSFPVGGPPVVIFNTVTTAKFRDEIVRVGLNYKIW